MSIVFRFRFVPFVATIVAAGIGISAGQWQSERAAYKTRLEAAQRTQSAAPPLAVDGTGATEQPPEFRRLEMTGTFVPQWTVYLDNRQYNGMPGFYVVTPFRLEGSQRHVLVARGWTPRQVADRAKLPDVATPEGVTAVTGIARTSLPRVLQLGDPQPVRPGAILQNVDIAELSAASGLTIQPYFVQQTGTAPDGLVRDWPQPSSGIDKHHGYAFQWYGLALMAVLFFIVTGIRREPR